MLDRLGPSRALLVGVGTLVALLLLALLAPRVSQALLVVFASVLFAVFLDGLAGLLRRYLDLGQLPALIIVLTGISGLLAILVVLAGPAIGEQLAQLGERLPEAVAKLRETLHSMPWTGTFLRNAPEASELVPDPGQILGEVTGVFSTTLGAVVNVAIILVTGIYLAVDPKIYRRGLVLLFPAQAQERVQQVVGALGHALRWWLVGRFATMLVVAVLTAVGLWIIDMPLVLALALTAGLLAFIPVVGPIVAAAPALLLALMDEPIKALNVVIVYSAVQFLEGNFITPLIQKRTVALAPAVLLVAQLMMGVLFGFMGVLLATPLTVTALVLIQMLYVQDLLGNPVRVMGQNGSSG